MHIQWCTYTYTHFIWIYCTALLKTHYLPGFISSFCPPPCQFWFSVSGDMSWLNLLLRLKDTQFSSLFILNLISYNAAQVIILGDITLLNHLISNKTSHRIPAAFCEKDCSLLNLDFSLIQSSFKKKKRQSCINTKNMNNIGMLTFLSDSELVYAFIC